MNIKAIEKNAKEVFGNYWKTLTPNERHTVENNIANVLKYTNTTNPTNEQIQLIASAIRNGFFIGLEY